MLELGKIIRELIEKILNRRNIERAIIAVERNHGAGGVDDRQSDELCPFVNANCQSLLQSVLEGSYKPSPVRRVEIPKATGGVRMLGSPTVVDRMLQQAIRRLMYDAGCAWTSTEFAEGSAHGLRVSAIPAALIVPIRADRPSNNFLVMML